MTGSLAQAAEPVLPPGYSLVAFDVVGSTNDEAKRLAEAGAADRMVVWAREQSGGRGRHARHWVSPRGNLFVSIILKPSVSPAMAANLGFVAALAVADVARDVCPSASVSLKWPNDVLIGDPLLPTSFLEGEEKNKALSPGGRGLGEGGTSASKISGILLESSLEAGRLEWLVLGIGINLIAAPSDTPYKAAALADFSLAPSPEQALTELIRAFDRWLSIWTVEGFAPIRAAWLDRGTPPGTPISIKEGNTTTEGTFIDLDIDGALLFGTDQGPRRVTAGDVYSWA